MTFQLKPDEALEALQQVKPDLAEHFEAILCSATTAMAQILAEHGDFTAGTATMEGVAFAGICVPVHPNYQGQPFPEYLEGYDNAEEWEESAKDESLPPVPAKGPPMRQFVNQIAAMKLTNESDGADLENDDAMDALISQARTLDTTLPYSGMTMTLEAIAALPVTSGGRRIIEKGSPIHAALDGLL